MSGPTAIVPRVEQVPSNATLRFGFKQPAEVAGTVGPGVYYLSPLANVPFVTFVGGEGYEKTISWGECFQNRSDGLVRVKNGSFHGGEIVLGTGQCASYPIPARITIPVLATKVPAVPPPTSFVFNQILDTRRARRAYLIVQMRTDAAVAGLQVIGQAVERFTVNTGSVFPGYVNDMIAPAFSDFGPIPLGMGASLDNHENVPHALLDQVTRVSILSGGTVTILNKNDGYYVLEYV